MKPSASLPFHALDVALLHAASWMVPISHREEWYREWTGELWHVRRDCVPVGAFSWIAERELIAFCIGAFPDAACLRGHAPEIPVASASMHGSARQCILWLCSVLVLCGMIAHFLPGIESEKEAAHAALPPGIILIQAGESGGDDRPSIAFGEYKNWQSKQQRFVTSLAFYRMTQERVDAGGADSAEWHVAHMTANLPAMLGVSMAPGAGDADVPHAMLSRSMWRRAFQADPAVVGQKILVRHREVRIAGIASPGAWQLPGHPDLWVVESSATASQAATGKGYVIALLSPLGRDQMTGAYVGITAYWPEGEAIPYHGRWLGPSTGGPTAIYLFAFLLAVLALPAITSVFQTESSFDAHRPATSARLKRFAFLVGKLTLIGFLGYFAAADIAYWNFPEYSSAAELLQFASSFCICLFGLRWALVDQSRRCPVCLRCVTHPAQVGIASCTFLGWNGTEMICTGGHVLLHVPSLPTSWFSRQRWMYLDTSWDFLFADTPGPL